MVETNEIVNALATSISAEKAYDSFIKYLTKLDNQDFLKVAKVFAYKNDNKFALNIPNAVNHNMVDAAIKARIFRGKAILQFICGEAVKRNLDK